MMDANGRVKGMDLLDSTGRRRDSARGRFADILRDEDMNALGLGFTVVELKLQS